MVHLETYDILLSINPSVGADATADARCEWTLMFLKISHISDRADDNSQMTALIAGITVPAIVFTCVLIALVCRLRHDSIPDGN